MRTTGIMIRKTNEFEVSECVIEKLIVLSEEKYRFFKTHLLEDQDVISDNKDVMFMAPSEEGKYISHCLLVMGEESQDGVLVRSEGSNYARYASYQPHMRSYLKEQIQMVADAILHGEFGKQEKGSWLIGWDDIKEHFDITVSKTNGIGQMLVDELESREEVAEIIATEDCIEMSVILMQDENAEAMDLLSVMGCNLTESMEDDMAEESPAMTQTM